MFIIIICFLQVGDGTTTVVLLAVEFLKQCKSFIEDGVHPHAIVRAFRKATNIAVNKIKEMAVTINKENPQEMRSILEKCAATSLNSKLIHQQKDFFAKMVVDAVMSLDILMPLDMIGMKKVSGGALEVNLLMTNK